MNGSRQKGFTLLELLVALVVFSLLVTTAYAGLRTSATSWERSEVRIAQNEAYRAVRRFSGRVLAETTPLARIEKGKWAVWFEGRDDRVVFTSYMPAQVKPSGLHEMALEVRRSEESGEPALHLVWQPFDPDAKPGEFKSDARSERVLMEGVSEIRVAYFGQTEGDQTGDWRDRWEEERALPSLVKIELKGELGQAYAPISARIRSDSVRFLRGRVRPGEAGSFRGEAEVEPEEDDQVPVPGSEAASEAGS